MIVKKIITLLLILKSFGIGYAQDLDSLLQEELNRNPTKQYVEATFKAGRIVLGRSIENASKGELVFLISHHFGTVNQGVSNFFGLDESSIRFGFEYGLTKTLSIGVGRSSYNKVYDGFFKLKLLRQSNGKGSIPLSLSLFSNIGITSVDWSVAERDNIFESRISYNYQLLIARKFSNRISLQLTPGMVHRNLVKTKEDENDVFSLGAGGRFKLSNRFSINAEYFYLMPGKTADDYFNPFSIGFDIETGGHVFQIFVTNSHAMIEQEFIPKTNGNWNDGDIRIGFNISRVFTIIKNKTIESDYGY